MLVDAVSDAYADACMKQEQSIEGVQYCEIGVGAPVDEREFFFTSEIHRIDIIGDATITDVRITAS